MEESVWDICKRWLGSCFNGAGFTFYHSYKSPNTFTSALPLCDNPNLPFLYSLNQKKDHNRNQGGFSYPPDTLGRILEEAMVQSIGTEFGERLCLSPLPSATLLRPLLKSAHLDRIGNRQFGGPFLQENSGWYRPPFPHAVSLTSSPRFSPMDVSPPNSTQMLENQYVLSTM